MNVREEIDRIRKQIRWHYGAIVGLKMQLAFWRELRACGIGSVFEIRPKEERGAGPSVVEEAHRIANGKGE